MYKATSGPPRYPLSISFKILFVQPCPSEILTMVHDVAAPAATTTWRSNLKVFSYCLVVGFAATAFGFDQGETGGFLAMEQ
jgi:hypothetical protein